jgi:gliding motility-associated protein GldE
LDYYSAQALLYKIAYLNTQGTTMLFVLLFCLLLISFMMSGAEVAFFSLTYKDINLLKTKPQSAYRKVVELLEEPKILLGVLLIANSFVNIAIIIISNVLIDELIHIQVAYEWLEFLIKVVVVTSILVLFGEVMPKVMATHNNIRFAKDVAPLISVVVYLFKRMSSWLVKYSDIIERKIANKKSNVSTNEELYHAIDLTHESSNEKERYILKGILKFGNTTVKQIMKTRLDVHGIDYAVNFQELLKQVSELHYSRLPVYKDDIDEIAGIIHTKDLIPYLNEAADFNWHTLLRQPYFVHEQKMIEDLLKEFQSKRIHFAIVVDEFGGTSGIVTMEDIMEEVIGEITDEFDEEDHSFKKLDDYNYIFEGKAMINDVCKFMNLPTDTFDEVKGESNSLAGLVLEIAGEMPKLNQVIMCGDFEFTVLELEKTRINKIKVTIKLVDTN